MNKQECLKALETLQEKYINLDVVDELICFKKLIDEYYELEKNFKILEKNYDELYDMVHYPKPYKFEDLKEGMWIWDNKNKVKLLIGYCYSEDDMAYYNFSNPEDYKYIHFNFEENRFFPVEKAMEE